MDDLPRCVETGQTVVTRLLNRLFSQSAVLEAHPHWSAFQTPGHLQELDAGCVEAVGLNAELVGHLKHHWPPSGLDAVHQAIVNAVLDGVPIRFSWKPARGLETSISASDTGTALLVKIFSPVAVAEVAREPVLA
jgi:hypothetical protein